MEDFLFPGFSPSLLRAGSNVVQEVTQFSTHVYFSKVSEPLLPNSNHKQAILNYICLFIICLSHLRRVLLDLRRSALLNLSALASRPGRRLLVPLNSSFVLQSRTT